MTIVTIDHIPNRQYEILGVVRGNVVQSKNFGRDFMSAMKGLMGGEIEAYTDMLNEARKIATGRMVKEAEELQADAILNLRYASSSVIQGAAECIAYGTAVRFVD